jgi:hypothetical protein
MEFQGKALYNLMRIGWLEEPSIAVQPWQVEDLKAIPLDTLFLRLQAIGINLTQASFLSFANESKTPEDLADLLWNREQDPEGHDKAYLLLFELWRRLLPDNFTLSIFCDELDWRIYYYDKDQLNEEKIEEAISDLENILDDNVDQGGEPKEIFQTVESYCGHDLERFLYDYIVEDIEKKDEISGSELLDGFYIYVSRASWFDFLRARLLIAVDEHEGGLMLQRQLEQLEEDPDLELLFEIAGYLVVRGDPSLFLKCVKIMTPLIKNEEQFQELIRLVGEYFCCLDKEEHHKTAQNFLLKRQNRPLQEPVAPTDLNNFNAFLEPFLSKE